MKNSLIKMNHSVYKSKNKINYLKILSFLIFILIVFNTIKIYDYNKINISGFNFIKEYDNNIIKLSNKYSIDIGSIITANNIRTYEELKLKRIILVPEESGIYTYKNNIIKKLDGKFDRLLSDKLIGITINDDGIFGGRLTSNYGERINPFKPWKKEYHYGWDVGAYKNTPVYLDFNGAIVFKTGYAYDYGKRVELYYNGYKVILGHLNKILINEGEIIKENTIIGLIGSTGRSTGNHLHFEIRKNINSKWKPINPSCFYSKDVSDTLVYNNIELWRN